MPQTFDSTGPRDYPVLCFPQTAGIASTNVFPDASTRDIVIPLHLKTYSLPQAKMMTDQLTATPITDRFGTDAFGGGAVIAGAREVPKASLEGYIETPFSEVTVRGVKKLVSQVTVNGAYYVTYTDLIAMFTDGQTAVSDDDMWRPRRPLWFRDPFGRVYLTPRILDFTAEYTEQTPFRTNFTMELHTI